MGFRIRHVLVCTIIIVVALISLRYAYFIVLDMNLTSAVANGRISVDRYKRITRTYPWPMGERK